MSQTFNCPACQAPLDLPEPVPLTVKCAYCQTTVVVPASLRQSNTSTHSIDQLPEEEANSKIAALRQISELVQKGQKIEAIRLFRETFDTSLTQAKEVIELIEQGVPVTPLTAEITRPLAPTVTITSTNYHPVYAPPTKVSSGGCSLVLGIVVLLFIGLAANFWLSGGSPATTFRNIGINGPARLLPVGDGAADLAFTIDDYSEEDQFSIGHLNGNNPEMQWESAAIAGNGYSSELYANNSQLFVNLETTLYAFNRDDGLQQWQTALSDRLPYTCLDCLLTFEELLVVLTYDDRLHGLSRQTGEILWQQDADVNRLLPLGEWVGVMRERADAGTGLEVLDPATGNLVRRLEPRCLDTYGYSDDPYTTDLVVVDAGTNTVYFLFDYPELCFQQWDFATGEQLLAAKIDSSAISSPSHTSNLATKDTLYLSQYNQIVALNTQNGTVRFTMEEDFYEFYFLEANAGTLLVQAINRRGTTREELWAVNAQTGITLWKHLPQADEMLVTGESEVIYEDDKGMWQAHLTNAGVILMQAQHNPPRVTFETLALSNGASIGQKELSLSVDKETSYWFVPIGWDKNLVWLNINFDKLWLVDPFTAELQARYP